jgi:ferredoxin
MMMAVDEKKRRFLKHLGIIAIGGALGMGLTKLTAKSTDTIVNTYSNKQIEENKKFIWETKTDFDDPRNWADYQEYLLNVNEGRTLDIKKTGAPIVNEVACAFHLEDESGEFHEGVYCTAPCKSICPVSVIETKDNKDSPKVKKVPTFKGKNFDVTNASGSKCIGCGKCFRICGYNAIHWINKRED